MHTIVVFISQIHNAHLFIPYKYPKIYDFQNSKTFSDIKIFFTTINLLTFRKRHTRPTVVTYYMLFFF
jgi:hypothetical protein